MSFHKGDKVAIINSTLGGRFLVESHGAKVVRDLGDGSYEVIMGRDRLVRFVDPAAQADPVAFVAALNARVPASTNEFARGAVHDGVDAEGRPTYRPVQA